MSDASEHLAPVSYLPWAKPEQERERDSVESAGRDEEHAPQPGPTTDASRSVGANSSIQSTGFSRSKNSRGSRSFARTARPFSAVEVESGAEPDGDDVAPETGPERDDRIDRIIVARLRRSSLSVAEVRSALVEHGLDAGEIEEWIERYERFGYLDDARLAEQLVHVNAGRRGKGSGAILQELTRRGVDAEAARAAIDGLDPETEFENALTVAERRVRQLRGLDRHVAERRLSAFLQRRGYSGEVVRQVVTQVLAAEGS